MSYKKGKIDGLGYIYKYLYNGKPVYVGQTKDLDRRIREHSKEIRFKNLTQIEFKGCSEQDLDDVEAYYINLYNPVLNKVHPKIKSKNINQIINRLFNWEKYKGQINFENDTTEYIPVKTAAELKKVSLQAIYKRINAGTLPMQMIDGQQCVPKDIILEEIGIPSETFNSLNNDNDNDNDNNNIILFLLDALEEQKEGTKDKYINLIQRYFGVSIND